MSKGKAKRGLGRGLGALIPPSSPQTSDLPNSGLRTVPILSIQPNPHQPRTIMDPEKLQELAASIKEHGLIQPLIVTASGDGYTLIAGERRWRASQLAGVTEVPVVVKEATPQEMLELAIIENVQRADLNALEEALAYQELMDSFEMTQQKVADRVGKGRSTVANLLRLLNLPKNIQEAVINDRISGAHARALLPLPTPEMQSMVMRDIEKFNLNVRQVEERVKHLMATEKPKPKPKRQLPPELKDMQLRFQERLGTRVRISQDKDEEESGRVVIHYYSDEELQAIFDAILPKKEVEEDDS